MNPVAMLASIVHCYVGCGTGAEDLQSLHVLECDTETGAAKIAQSVKGIQGTTYFAFDEDGRHLYSAIGEKKAGRRTGTVVRFAMDGWRIGAMERLAELPCETPCHVALSPDGGRVAFAAYGSAVAGTVGVDGNGLCTFSFPSDAMGPNAKRQERAHAHQTFFLPDGRLGVVDLGCDRIWFFDPATMKRDSSLAVEMDPGDGPRHCVLSKDGRFLFVLSELSSSVASYALPSLMRIGKWSMLPKGFSRWEADGETLATKAAAIKLTADGKILMASNRGHDSIAFYSVGDDGRLSLRNIARLTGKFPRDFALLPGERFMVVGHKMSNEIQMYRFDREDCSLTPVGKPIPAWRPLCFMFGAR